LAANNITIHQAFYGEVNRAHACIKQTLSDPDLISFLITFTDRPAALPPGVTLSPYISGSPFLKYYVFTKTFPDPSATRAGMVFTHVLILNLEDIIHISRLEDVFSHFVESTQNKVNELQELQVEIIDSSTNSPSKQQPKYIQETISAYISGVNPILFTGDNSAFTNALQVIWNSPNTLLKKKIKFRTSFTLSDIEGVKDLTIVSIQKDFLPKWQAQKIIVGESHTEVEVNSYSEALFLGHINENPFYNFIIELNANLSEVQSYGQYEKIFTNYSSIGKVDDANILRQDIRTLGKISPSSKDGKVIKEKYLDRLVTLIRDKKDNNLKALRNVDWSAFENGEEKGKEIISTFLESELENPNQNQFQQLSELIDIAITDRGQNWWHQTIKESISNVFKKQSVVSLNNFWQLLDLGEATSNNLLSLILPIHGCDAILRESIPNKLQERTCISLTYFARTNHFYLLHADILLKEFSLEESIEIQLQLEDRLTLANSVGLKYLIEKLTDEKLVALAVKLNDPKLIELSVEVIEKNTALLKDIDLSISSWLDIWTLFVVKTKKIFAGMTGNETKIVSSVLDMVTNGITINDAVIGLIADSPFSDLSDYKNRNKIWGAINTAHKEKFLGVTTKSVLENLLTGKIKPNTIESEITERITSDSFMTNFLSENRNNIESVIIVFSSFTSLKDTFLSDYITNYRGEISEEQATKLGELVNSMEFKKSARSIYDKARYNQSFTPAYAHCRGLVSLNWWESIWSSGSPLPKTSHSFSTPILTKEESFLGSLPTVVILTAIKEEYMAVREHLKDLVDADINDTTYEAGTYQFNGKEISKVIIRECGAKNTNAAQETERAIQYFKPNMILFVGIAGSRKPKDFSIGDVIFPEKVYSYEGGKSEKETFLSRPDNALMSYSLYEIAKKERKKDDWKSLIKGEWNQEVKADLGIIASGEQVVEHYDSEIGKILQKYFNDTSAVEMEGFGFGKAANRQGRETSHILIGVVRGISDIIEQSSKKEKNKNEDRRPTNAKVFASATAAAFTFWLILKTFEK
jgi:nucleoside phosphorylase